MTIATSYEQVTYNSPDGAQMGKAATEKVAFYGATPITQPTSSAQTALTTVTAVSGGFGFVTSAALTAFIAQVENIRASLVLLGLLKGS